MHTQRKKLLPGGKRGLASHWTEGEGSHPKTKRQATALLNGRGKNFLEIAKMVQYVRAACLEETVGSQME